MSVIKKMTRVSVWQRKTKSVCFACNNDKPLLTRPFIMFNSQVTCVILARACMVDIVECFTVTPSVTVLRFTKEISVKVCLNKIIFSFIHITFAESYIHLRDRIISCLMHRNVG